MLARIDRTEYTPPPGIPPLWQLVTTFLNIGAFGFGGGIKLAGGLPLKVRVETMPMIIMV